MKTTIHGKICFTSHIKPRPISIQGSQALGLIMESWVEMGCHIEFAMYYTLFFTCIIKTHMDYIPITLPFTIRRKTKYAVRKMDIQKGEIVNKTCILLLSISFLAFSNHRKHLFTKSIYTDLQRKLGCFHFRSIFLNLAFKLIAIQKFTSFNCSSFKCREQ